MMLLSILSGFIAAVLILCAGRFLKSSITKFLALLPLGLFVYYLSLSSGITGGKALLYKYTWVPSLGVQLHFNFDGLSLLFCLLITGIGTLVFLYASSYMKGRAYPARFFCYLCIFMASMLGLVLSDNVIALFIFWELTSISSFFLIGFNDKDAAARKSALLALAVTGGGGFLLLAGFVLMGSISGSYSITAMAANPALLQNHNLYWLMLLLVFAGAFTKSAQFPFHFWLPAAMKAPSPVSAYLHSATMVKAGIFLLARFTPVLGNNIYWNNTLLIVGGITMLYAAIHALFRTDLKSILAYSTISALGLLIFLMGIGTPQALLAATVFIIVHALYKAGLFLIAGIIDKVAGTRNVTQLSGLRKVMLPVAVAGLLAALSCAGIPFTIGFIGKELMYEATLNSSNLLVLLTVTVVLTNILLLYTGLVTGIKPFAGKLPDTFNKIQLPAAFMWFPPLLLAVTGLVLGIFPALIYSWLVQPVVFAINGVMPSTPLMLWHGFNTVLLLSGLTIAGGIMLYFLLKPKDERLLVAKHFQAFSPQVLLLKSTNAVQSVANWYMKMFRIGHLRTYILIIIVFLISLLSYKLFTGVKIYIDTAGLQEITIYEAAVVSIMLMAIFKTVQTASRLTAVASMGVVGYCICLLFVFYSAPDLAMTQFTIDTLTVVLFVLVLFRLPGYLTFTNTWVKIRDGIVALGFGSLISIIALQVLNEPVSKETGDFYAANAYLLAKGKNVVNVILVDFRGFDTLVEITVLTIAAIGVYSMLKLKISNREKE